MEIQPGDQQVFIKIKKEREDKIKKQGGGREQPFPDILTTRWIWTETEDQAKKQKPSYNMENDGKRFCLPHMQRKPAGMI